MNTIIHVLPGQFDIGVRDLKNLSSSKNFGYVPEYEFHKGIKLGTMSQAEFLINKYLKYKYSKGINLGYMTKNKFLVSKYLTKSIPQNTVRCEDTGEVFMIK